MTDQAPERRIGMEGKLRRALREAEERETLAADAAVGYLERAEKAEAERDALRADLHHVIDERDRTFALMLERAEKAERDLAAHRAIAGDSHE